MLSMGFCGVEVKGLCFVDILDFFDWVTILSRRFAVPAFSFPLIHVAEQAGSKTVGRSAMLKIFPSNDPKIITIHARPYSDCLA